MTELMDALREENGKLRGLTGSGQPGLYSVLGGTVEEQNSSDLKLMGGAGQVSATSRIAMAHRDVRLAAVARGTSVPAPGTGGGGGGSGRPGGNRPPTQAK